MLVIGSVQYVYYTGYSNNENNTLKGHLAIYNNGIKVYDAPDLIQLPYYDYIMCMLYNNTVACNNPVLTNYYLSLVNPCSSNGGTYGTKFTRHSDCTATSIILSNSTSTPLQNSLCDNILPLGEGLDPARARTTYTNDSNIIVLNATWTATSTQIGISKVCLSMWNNHYNYSAVSPTNIAVVDFQKQITLAQDLIPPQTVLVNQTFTIVWSFSF